MDKHASIMGIILAAGSSSRMAQGQHKLLLPLGKRPVITHVLDAALASQLHSILLILGHRADEITEQLDSYTPHPRITLLRNHHYMKGMSSSIHTGLHFMQTDPQLKTAIQGALIMLGDQPLLTPQIIDTLITTHSATGKQIIAPLYEGKRGTPVLFDRELFPDLLEISGDEGGKSVIAGHAQDVACVEIGNEQAGYDVDTWEAYLQVVARWQRNQEDA